MCKVSVFSYFWLIVIEIHLMNYKNWVQIVPELFIVAI